MGKPLSTEPRFIWLTVVLHRTGVLWQGGTRSRVVAGVDDVKVSG